MGRKVQLGLYPTNGTVIDGTILQTARIDRAGAYDATNGTVVGDSTRTGPWRIYSNFDDVIGGTVFAPGSPEWQAHKAGHTVVLSWGQGSYLSSAYRAAHTSTSWWAAVAAGYADTQLKNAFAAIHAMPFGTAVTPVATTIGSREPVPGSTKGGTTPTEVVLVPTSHEPNIGATQFGTPAEFASAMKHVMTTYDTWRVAQGFGTVRIKFCVIISNPGSSVFGVCGGTGSGANYYGVGTGNDISGASARPVDYPGWDIYFPQVEKGNGPVSPGPLSGGNGNAVSFGSKFTQLNTWTYSTAAGGGHFSSSTRQVIGEIAARIQTARSSDGTAVDTTWPSIFWNDGTNGFTAWNAAHALSPSGDHPLIYVCSYAAGSLMKSGATYGNGASGNIDNSIIPDTTTYTGSFQNGGFSLRTAFTAFRTCLVANGNETLVGGGSPGVVPIGVAATTPGAGATSATLSWTLNGANVTYNVYKDGALTQSGLTAGSTVVFASAGVLPQTHSYTVTGIGTNGAETAQSSAATVNYTAAVGTPPLTPTGLVVSNVQQTTATATCSAPANTTGYTWVVDGSQTFTTSSPTVNLTPLTSGTSHTVTVAAFNAAGSSPTSAGVAFTTASSPDTTAPSVPTGLAGVYASGQVALSWAASTDTVVAGQITSGMGTYTVQRSLSPVAGTGTTISSTSLSGTSFTDLAPPSSPSGATVVYYTVAATDNALNQSAFSSPVAVTIPATFVPSGPTAAISAPPSLQAAQLFSADASGSLPGTGGAIISYRFDFNDGIIVGPQAGSSAVHAYPMLGLTSPQQFTITLTVTDASGLTGTASQSVVVAPPATGTNLFPYTGTPMFSKGAKMTADVFNVLGLAHENALSSIDGRTGANEVTLGLLGNPVTPRRHSGALYTSVAPEAAGSAFTIVPATMYAIRCVTGGGSQISTVRWTQTSTTVSAGVTNSFWALYDVTGALVSASTATDCSTLWLTQQECSYVLDGGPFDPPIGADNTSSTQVQPTQEFFLAFWVAAAGANKPQIAIGSNFANAVNLGTSVSAITPTQANIQQVPLFSTAANGPSVALQPPATLGALTRLGASMLVAVY